MIIGILNYEKNVPFLTVITDEKIFYIKIKSK
jgi:hypothetical protein